MSAATEHTLAQIRSHLRNAALAPDAASRRAHAQAAWDASLTVLATDDSTASQRQSALRGFTEARALFEAADDLPHQDATDAGASQP